MSSDVSELPQSADADRAQGYVHFRNGEGTLADRLVCHDGYVSIIVGQTSRKVPWDRIEYVDKYIERPDGSVSDQLHKIITEADDE